MRSVVDRNVFMRLIPVFICETNLPSYLSNIYHFNIYIYISIYITSSIYIYKYIYIYHCNIYIEVYISLQVYIYI